MKRLLTYLWLTMLTGCASTSWEQNLHQQLSVMGHRNFVVIADSAYPHQSNPGIQTICTGDNHPEVIRKVLAAIDATAHVKPVVYVDTELQHVAESDACGVTAYRDNLRQLLNNKRTQQIPHERIIEKLDQAAGLFTVLILKTNMVLPYTSVFIELDCGYWNDTAERSLREAMASQTSR